MSWLLAFFVVASFALAFERLRLPQHAREVGSRARESLRILRDPSLDDYGKEKALQHHALQMFRLFGILLGGSLLAIGLPLLSVWLLDLADAASLESVLVVLERLDFLVGVSLVGGLAYLALGRSG